MAPRKSLWSLWVVGFSVALSLLFSPVVIASLPYHAIGSDGSGGGGVYQPPNSGPGPGGGGGDPDDFSIYFNRPADPTIVSDRHQRTELPAVLSKVEKYRWGAWYVLQFMIGIRR
jgi:hypothetical protein